MDVSYDVAGTLRAQEHYHPPLIYDARGNGGENMPHDNRRSPEPNNGLHGAGVLCFAEKRFFKWQPDEVSVSLRAKSASYGGGSEVLVVDVLPFDTTQITSDKNWSHPHYGDPCHPLAQNQHPPSVVVACGGEDG